MFYASGCHFRKPSVISDSPRQRGWKESQWGRGDGTRKERRCDHDEEKGRSWGCGGRQEARTAWVIWNGLAWHSQDRSSSSSLGSTPFFTSFFPSVKWGWTLLSSQLCEKGKIILVKHLALLTTLWKRQNHTSETFGKWQALRPGKGFARKERSTAVARKMTICHSENASSYSVYLILYNRHIQSS